MDAMQDGMHNCPICNHEKSKLKGKGPLNRMFFVNCPQCGKYEIQDGLNLFSTKEKPYLISAWIREQNERGKIPEITTDTLEKLRKIPDPTVSEKQLYLMQALERRTEYPGARVDVTSPAFTALAWCKNRQELIFHSKSLYERELLAALKTDQAFAVQVMITAKGWDFLEANRHKSRKDSRKVFIAMWFDKSMDPASDAIYKTIEETKKYEPTRIDRVEHIDKIDDKIIADIKSSKFLVADFTGNSNGVYFEAGFARGLDIPVIWSVRKDYLNKIHFDTRQFCHIVWENEQDLKTKLINRIKAVID